MSNITPACPKCGRVLKVQAVLAGFYCGYCGHTFKCEGGGLNLPAEAKERGGWTGRSVVARYRREAG